MLSVRSRFAFGSLLFQLDEREIAMNIRQDRLAASEPMHARRCASEFCDAGFRG
jgi:hypothetical protein